MFYILILKYLCVRPPICRRKPSFLHTAIQALSILPVYKSYPILIEGRFYLLPLNHQQNHPNHHSYQQNNPHFLMRGMDLYLVRSVLGSDLRESVRSQWQLPAQFLPHHNPTASLFLQFFYLPLPVKTQCFPIGSLSIVLISSLRDSDRQLWYQIIYFYLFHMWPIIYSIHPGHTVHHTPT